MSSPARITVHPSQFPENVRRALLDSLRERRINHKFHYDSFKQTQKWLALHQAYSPSRNDPVCAAIYDRGFESVARRLTEKQVHVIGLGCGGGQKDTRLLGLLQGQGREVFYTPCDVSAAMTLTARQTALAVIPEENCFPFVCDLCLAEDLPQVLAENIPENAARLLTFFGMIPNFEPQEVLPKLAGLVRSNDWLLFSANLAPGNDFESGMRKILPQYDNELTRDWLMTFLLDLGIEREDGELRFTVEDGWAGLKRVIGRFYFNRERELRLESARFVFSAGTLIQLFYSYRYTPDLARELLAQSGIEMLETWITPSEEEAVFLCRPKL